MNDPPCNNQPLNDSAFPDSTISLKSESENANILSSNNQHRECSSQKKINIATEKREETDEVKAKEQLEKGGGKYRQNSSRTDDDDDDLAEENAVNLVVLDEVSAAAGGKAYCKFCIG